MTEPESSQLPTHTAVDAQNPWPGLESFKEGDAFFFHGRDQETAELLRLINRETLTVLFSRSGVGKTSLLLAGVFPRLRELEYIPVYIRLDHALTVKPHADQVISAVLKAVEEAECEAPDQIPGQTLWEYFHRRDADFWSKKNSPIIPVLVLDQFEEIFTLGRQSEEHRARSESFLNELADLIENRPAMAVREKLELNESEASTFSSSKESCKIILSLREDYLPELESAQVRTLMPSIMSNRLRIQPLQGEQALTVVLKPGKDLVNDVVANQIVVFVAGAESVQENGHNRPPAIKHLEIDPALLSLFCRELNTQRIKLQQPQITSDLLEGHSKEILTKFYEDCIAALPEPARKKARQFLEDCLLTEFGHRDNIALTEALKRPGVSEDVINELVSRRLIRLDERQTGTPRVELAHDVLTKVVIAGRDARYAERDRADAEARAAQEHERAERERIEKERLEKANKRAEALIEFMLYNLSGKLGSVGQLQLLKEVNEKTLEYFDGFEPAEQIWTLKWNKAVALQNRGSICLDAGKVREAYEAQSASLEIFRELVKGENAGDAHRNAVASQGNAVASVLAVQGNTPAALQLYQEAFDITQELLKGPNAETYRANLPYFRDRIADILKAQGKLDLAMDLYRESLKEREARKVGDDWEEGIQSELSDSYISIGDGLRVQGQLAKALEHFNLSLEIRKKLVEVNPNSVICQQNLSQSYDRVGEALQASAKMNDALEKFRLSDEIFQRLIVLDSSGSANWNRNFSVTRMRLAEIQSLAGSTAPAVDVFNRVLVLRQTLADIDETSADAQDDLADALIRAGDGEVLYGKLTEAAAHFQRAVEIRSKLGEQDPTNADRRSRLSEALERQGDLLCSRGDFNEGLLKYVASQTIRDRLAEEDKTNLGRAADVAASIEKIGDAQRGLSQPVLARDSFAAAVAKKTELAAADPENAQWQALQAVALRKLAESYVALGDLPKAFETFLESSNILSRLTEIAEQYAEWMSYFGDLLCSFAVARRMNGEGTTAIKGLRPTINVREAIAKMDENNVKRQAELARTLYLGATTLLDVEPQSKAEAATWLKQANDIMMKCRDTAELTQEQEAWLAEIAVAASANPVLETAALAPAVDPQLEQATEGA